MMGRKSTLGICWVLSFGLLYGKCYGGPAKRPSRMVREIYPEIEQESEGNQAQVCIVGDVVYGMDEAVPAEQPCLKCKCQAPGVQCETIQCVKRPGCKAIHKPNKCCPDYQCECEFNGKFYANGEKLETSPGGECKVCYCRGGEVQCAEVSCYIRKDCEGKRVPGTCCPKYDHCPPIDPSSNRLPYTTEIIIASPNKDEVEPWVINGRSSNSTENVLFSPTSSDFQNENKIPDTNYYEVTTPSFKMVDTESFQNDASVLPRITIQEIIPERKEIPITAPPKIEVESQGTLVIEEAESVDSSNDLTVTDVDIESSEISEVFHRPPPVLRVGDKLLFLNKGEFVHDNESSTPDSVITVVGAEGLQRGYEDSGEVHELKVDHFSNIENSNTEAPTFETSSTVSLDDSKNLNELLLNTAASTHILSLVKRKNQETPYIQSTTESLNSTESLDISKSSTEFEEITTTPSNQQVLSEAAFINATEVTTVDTINKENKDTGKSYITGTLTHNNTDEIVIEQNPAYPPIPEILSPNMDDTSQRFDLDNNEKEIYENMSTPEPKILPQVLDKRSNKTVPQNISHGDWLKTNPNTLINVEATLPDELLNQPAPTDFEENSNSTDDLSTSDEETSSTTEIGSETNTKLDSTIDKLTKSVEMIEDSNEESGENTTPKSKNAAIMSSENASVESEESSEANDMVEMKQKHGNENTEDTTPTNVKLIDNIDETKKNETVLRNDDVEIIDTTTFQKEKPTIPKNIASTSIPEFLPKPEKIVQRTLKILKRESPTSEDTEDVFKDLEKEISDDQTERNQSSEEEQKESEAIFKELLEDTSTPRSRNKDNDAFSKITDALTQSDLKSGASNSKIFGVLSSFLRSDNGRFK